LVKDTSCVCSENHAESLTLEAKRSFLNNMPGLISNCRSVKLLEK